MKKWAYLITDKGLTQKSLWVLFILTAVFFTGCSSKYQLQEMALTPEDSLSDIQGSYISLLSISTDNQFKPTWPPEVYSIEITDQRTQEKIQVALFSMSKMDLIKKGLFEMGQIDEGGSTWEGLVSFHLPPGQYRISAVRGGCIRSGLIGIGTASFNFPFDIPFQVERDQFVYLGNITMINRERVSDDEIPSGDNTVIRLTQKQSGFGTGTFDVIIKDFYESDIRKFQAKYPAMAGQKIVKQILPPWEKTSRMMED
jgi:hypothetical protein